MRAINGIVRRMRERGQRLIMCGRAIAEPRKMVLPGVIVVEYDHVGGSAQAVKLLLAKGHRMVGMIRGPQGFSTSDARSLGFRRGMKQYGCRYDPDLIWQGTSRHYDDGYRGTHELLNAHPKVTAIFAENDSLAVGVLKAAHERGLEVPRDLSVIGFDNLVGTEFTTPALTTVQMPFPELGCHAARIALGLEPAPPTTGRIMIPTRLIERDSVAAPRSQ